MQRIYSSTTSTSTGSHTWGLVLWTVVNVFLIWPWYLLRVQFDAGEHHPDLVLGLLVLTLWGWSQLISALLKRFRETRLLHRGNDERPNRHRLP
jgi:hypothetical protein